MLLNNIAWTLRKFPVMFMPGRGDYAIQPVFVEDLAKLAIEVSDRNENIETDAVGPEIYSYHIMLRTIRGKTGSRCLLIPAPKWLTHAASKMLGVALGDIVLTKDEIKGLSRGLLVSRSKTLSPCPTRLSDWLDQNAHNLGREYASEVARHYR